MTVSNNEHIELAISPTFAAISDIGIRHAENEDSVCIRLFDKNGIKYHVMAVCDGLSSTVAAGIASDTAAKTCVNALAEMINASAPNPMGCMVKAIQQAHSAVCDLGIKGNEDKDPPGTTIVAAVAWKGHAIIAWVGDSRAYLFSNSGAELLTHDHSWINEVVDAGMMSEAEAENSPNAHVITRCLGPVEESSMNTPPQVSVIQKDLPNACRLLLCSDGLWNYGPNPQELAALIAETPTSSNAMEHARALIEIANECGGHDNITVAICDFS
jgi:serine/threonine protein phosphatase PrpC